MLEGLFFYTDGSCAKGGLFFYTLGNCARGECSSTPTAAVLDGTVFTPMAAVLQETVLYTHGSCARGDCSSTLTAAVLERLFLYTLGSCAGGYCSLLVPYFTSTSTLF